MPSRCPAAFDHDKWVAIKHVARQSIHVRKYGGKAAAVQDAGAAADLSQGILGVIYVCYIEQMLLARTCKRLCAPWLAPK